MSRIRYPNPLTPEAEALEKSKELAKQGKIFDSAGERVHTKAFGALDEMIKLPQAVQKRVFAVRMHVDKVNRHNILHYWKINS